MAGAQSAGLMLRRGHPACLRSSTTAQPAGTTRRPRAATPYAQFDRGDGHSRAPSQNVAVGSALRCGARSSRSGRPRGGFRQEGRAAVQGGRSPFAGPACARKDPRCVSRAQVNETRKRLVPRMCLPARRNYELPGRMPTARETKRAGPRIWCRHATRTRRPSASD